MRQLIAMSILVATLSLQGGLARSADLFNGSGFAALASDRQASRVGDALTVIVFESATASNTVQGGADRQTRIAGRVAGGSFDEGGALALDSKSDRKGQTARAGRIAAQITVVVEEVLPNGDLRVAGEQVLKINGERTRLKLRGRVRRADISPENVVLSSRLADAQIDYDGSGFVSRGARPGLLDTLFGWLGL